MKSCTVKLADSLSTRWAATIIGLLFSICVTTSAVAGTIYVVDRTFSATSSTSTGVRVTGYIETNGQIGPLSNNDIIDWNFLFPGDFVLENRSGDTREIRSIEGRLVAFEPSSFGFAPGRVSATETGLFFDFSSHSQLIVDQLTVRSTVSSASRRCAGGFITDPREWTMEVTFLPEIREFSGEYVKTGACPQPNTLHNPVDGLTPHSGIIQFASVQPLTNPIPIPPAIWLFGSGLIGLLGVARRKKA